QYGPTDCHPRLKPELKKWHQAKDGWTPDDGQMQVLNGSQEGLHIMAYLFLDPGDAVAVSEPAYPGALGAFKGFTDNFISFPIDENGSDTNVLEAILARRRSNGQSMPKFIYEVPNGHNPGGVTLSLERRKHLLEIAREFDILILEDDPYQLVLLDKVEIIPTIQKLDNEGQVIRLDCFSKIFAPGLRIGYATGPADIINKFQLYKQGTNLHVSSMIQVILAGFLQEHGPDTFRQLIEENCKLYRSNRDVMVQALRQFLPISTKFNIPQAGMFVWLELQQKIDTQVMLDRFGLQEKVLMVPGNAFSTTGSMSNFMRLSFSMVTSGQIVEGVKRLANMIGNYA
ncbi:PLP-dependent aminotransferase family protein, partial [bacterium]|nr:PLP-dependent aminotransferase family protein [bacterium]